MTGSATVRMWGNTRAVRIPKAIAKSLGLEAGTHVVLTATKDGLMLKPIARRKVYRLSELLAQAKGRNPHREAIRGRRGREIF